MIQFTGIDTKQNIYFTQKKPSKVQPQPNFEHREYHPIQDKAISLGEGTELFVGGLLKQGKEMITSIIKHPLKSAGIMLGTSAAFMALPLVGIPSAVGGGILAIGFAGYAIGKALYHTAQFAKTNQKGSYDIARIHLQQMGEDTFDIALSAPFAPKAASNIKNFVKYGKIGVNSELIANIKSANKFTEKIRILAKTDTELSRNFNFQNAVDKEIRNLKDLNDAQKAQIKKELLEFNIEAEKIPELVLRKYGEAKGITTMPDLEYIPMASNTQGIAVANDCKIYLNNNKPYKGKPTFSEYTTIKQELINGEYKITYKHKPTGDIIVETCAADIVDKYNTLCQLYKELSPESVKILTILHEREHIHQFAQVFATQGYDWIPGEVTPRAKDLFNKMAAEMKTSEPLSAEALEKIASYTKGAENGTPLSYIKTPREIAARQFEVEACTHPTFLPLDGVFKTMKYSKGLSIGENILINDVRIESSNS